MKLKTLITELKKRGYQLIVDRDLNVLTVSKFISEGDGYGVVAKLSTDGFTIDTEYAMFRGLAESEREFLTNKLFSFIQTDVKEREIVGYYSLKINWLTGVKVKYLGYAEGERVFITEGKHAHEEADIVELKEVKEVPVESMTLVDLLNNKEYLPYTWTVENGKLIYANRSGKKVNDEVVI